LMLRQAGPHRVMGIAEIEVYVGRAPSMPPSPPPPSPPPIPPASPPVGPSPPSPPLPPRHPPFAVISDWEAGFAQRIWGCCKPSCSFPQNHHIFGDPQTPFCDVLGNRNPMRFAKDGCWKGEGSNGYQCFEQAPWRDDTDPLLSYGFFAGSSRIAGCNRCFELDFGSSIGHLDPGNIGSRRLAKARKRMVVQSVTIWPDDGHGPGGANSAEDFHLYIPGGGVQWQGNACNLQWELEARQVDAGMEHGGMLSRCQGCPGDDSRGCVPDRTKSHEEVRACVKMMCNITFGMPRLHNLKASCDWFADWFEIADIPRFRYREVGCPQAILAVTGPGA